MHRTRSPLVAFQAACRGLARGNRAVGVPGRSFDFQKTISWRSQSHSAFREPGSAPIEVQVTPESPAVDSTPPLLGGWRPSAAPVEPRCCAGASQRIPGPCPGRCQSRPSSARSCSGSETAAVGWGLHRLTPTGGYFPVSAPDPPGMAPDAARGWADCPLGIPGLCARIRGRRLPA
jgi:hypothetical protein